jgi:hypothetical protein
MLKKIIDVGLACIFALSFPSVSLAADEICEAPEVLGDRWYLPDEPLPFDFLSRRYEYSPKLMYQKAHEEFQACNKEDATYWMYLGQLRYRSMLHCIEGGGLESQRTPFGSDYRNDEFSALLSDIGLYINEWAGGDLQLWVDALTRAANDYQSVDDKFVPKEKCTGAIERNLSGIHAFRAHLANDPDGFRSSRTSNSLENRSSGPVVVRDNAQ